MFIGRGHWNAFIIFLDCSHIYTLTYEALMENSVMLIITNLLLQLLFKEMNKTNMQVRIIICLFIRKQSTGRHVTLARHIILSLTCPDFAVAP